MPLHRREELGVVWDEDATVPSEFRPAPSAPVAESRLKPVSALLEVPPMPAASRRFVDWVAGYTLAPPGLVMAMALRVGAFASVRSVRGWGLPAAMPAHARLTPARLRVLAALREQAPRDASALARAAGTSVAVIRTMAEAGLLHPVELAHAPVFRRPDPRHRGGLSLSAAQSVAAEDLRGQVRARAFSVTLLEGVTGSGKTELYLEAVAECIAAGRQALVLLPEIALSSQWLQRFEARFGVEPAVWHSDLGAKRRHTTWRAVACGEAPVVVGARSALFLPFTDLGLVVVDEEHETAFKQEDGVTYNARDMAVVAGTPFHRAGPAGLGDAEPGDAGQCRGRSLPADGAGGPARPRPPA